MQDKKTNKNQNNNIGGGGGGIGSANSGAATSVAPGNIVLRFEADAKASIFNVLYILLKDCDISFWKFAILLLIDFL